MDNFELKKQVSVPMYINKNVLDARVMNSVEFLNALTLLKMAKSALTSKSTKPDLERVEAKLTMAIDQLEDASEWITEILSDVHYNIEHLKKQE